MRVAWIAIVAAALSVAAASVAGAERGSETQTRGEVCSPSSGCGDRTLEAFGGYEFRGTTTPSQPGQKVVFEYRRDGAKRWHRFGAYDPSGGGPAFRSLEGGPSARIRGNDRWTFAFSAYEPGAFRLRAKFRAQDGLGQSTDKQRVTVSGSD